MCKMCGESVDRLLLHCLIASELWSLVFCLFGLHWVMPLKVVQLFESWQGKFGRHRNFFFFFLETCATLLDVVYLERKEC